MKDIAIYADGALGKEVVNAIGANDIKQYMTAIKDWAKEQGFESLRITGTRVSGSSSAKTGKKIDLTFNLTN